ncbi:hypothetical protein OHA98_40975 [Streptomyces sp. NBC_00654]|uniref:hypothetical protein n=1 Tax=Streptomyces sp. NBC_00654 TaxID=2975799 RepID=UPI00225494CB|nr:hypothetical protein [Streptomyces sp. NBC_00654]MCX4970990.1 hypothetical protein [Streptomyces sp. NBC_00654]
MKRPFFRRCGHAPGTALTPEDQAVVDHARAMLAALRNSKPWTPGGAQDIAVRVGPFVERAHTRPGDDHGPDLIAVALVHPDTPHAAAYSTAALSTQNRLPGDCCLSPTNTKARTSVNAAGSTGLLRFGPSGPLLSRVKVDLSGAGSPAL